jgi:hypothetical protein
LAVKSARPKGLAGTAVERVGVMATNPGDPDDTEPFVDSINVR